MKIKRKVEMNLPQLIEWGFENDVTGAMFPDNRVKAKMVRFEVGVVISIYGYMNKQDTFTVEVEEEIDEDTEFEKLYYTTILSRIVESSCTTIQSSLKHIAVEPIAFYIMNDDLTLTLIWRDGKLVE